MDIRIKGKFNRHGKNNGSRVKTKPGFSYRVYCSTCLIPDMGHPETAPHGSASGKVFVCSAGHRTPVRN